MSLADLRSAIVDQLSSGLGSTVNVMAHGGRFTLNELKRYAVKGPSVPIACLGVVKAEPSAAGGVEVSAAWGAFVVCADKPNLPRDTGALALVTALLPLISGNLWNRDDVDSPAKVRADNLYTSQLDQQGVALWAVTWQQEITLGRIDPATLDDLLTVVAAWDLDTGSDGEPEPADTIELEGGS